MRLSKRIYKMADMIARGESVADIGTDHGYVPMILMRDGISPRVIMSDISEGSLAKAKETFKIAGLDAPEGDFRTGDGVETIGRSEVDVVIIGGLGGHTIVEILDADIEKTRSFKRFVLQPRKHSGALRYYLYTHGFDITEEALSPEGKFECEIIVAEPSSEQEREAPYPEDDIRWKYPGTLMDADAELAAKRIRWKLSSIDEQIHSLEKSSEIREDLVEQLKQDKMYLMGLIESKE